MSFIAGGNLPETTEEEIENFLFFPRLSLTDFRSAMRVDSVAAQARARHALHGAMLEVNSRLATWMQAHINSGVSQLADVPERPGAPAGSNLMLYKTACWSLAKAMLVERYRDYDTSRTGNEKADELEPMADDYRRDAAWAINDLTRRARTVVELI